ncbi:MAG: energy-coupling factor transporter transmembrane component T [Moorellaceae bacterium]
MLDRLLYRDKGVFLQQVRTTVTLTYLGALFALALLFSHPLYLAGILLISLLAVLAAQMVEEWEPYFKMGLGTAVLIMVINALVFRLGKTMWGTGWMKVSLEAICYGAAMGVRLLTITTVFCLFNGLVHPDKLLRLFSRWAFKSALVVSLATRMFPLLVRHWFNAWEVLQMRGVDYAGGGWKERLKKYSWVLDMLLLSSLEGAWQVAEAMEARAFGTGPRSCYQQEPTRPRDFLCLASSLAALGLALYAKMQGYGDFKYYPQLDPLLPNTSVIVFLAMIMIFLAGPLFLSWGWRLCPCLRSKI